MNLSSFFSQIFFSVSSWIAGKKVDFDYSGLQNGYYTVGCSPQYYLCIDHIAYGKSCSDGELYSTTTESCVDESSHPLCNSPTKQMKKTFSSKCSGRSTGFYSDGCSYDYFSCGSTGISLHRCTQIADCFDSVTKTCTSCHHVAECINNGKIYTHDFHNM